MLRASRTISVLRLVDRAHPTTRRLHASRTTARYRKPAQVGTYVMSATQSWSGPLATKRRWTRSAEARASLSRTVVNTRLRRQMPVRPASRMSRATRFLPTATPSAASSACKRGAPYVPRDATWARSSRAESSRSRRLRSESRRPHQA